MKRGSFIFLALLLAVLSGCASGKSRVQTSASGRLYAVAERDANTNGYNWTATYDGLNRRLSTTSVLVTNGIAFTASPTVINSYYDPQVEFLELGVNYGATTEWKLYGPDLSGVYGGMNGVGGLDAVSPLLNLFYPTLSDERGNVLGVVANSAVSWNPARPTGYGAVPGHLPLPLANGADLSLASAWRGRWADITGFYNIGLRPYDPASGRWLTFDSVWNETDPNGLSFCGGDPINPMDHDGRVSASYYNQNPTQGLGYDNAAPDLYAGIAPVMGQYLQTTTHFENGTSVATGLPGEPNQYIDPSQIVGNSYNNVTMPTGQYGFYISPTPLPDGQVTSTPISQWDVQEQMDKNYLFGLTTVAASLLTDTEGAAPDTLAADSGAFANYMRQAQTLDVSTAPNTAVFYSGPVNRALAEQFATANGGTTLEMTPGGAWLDQQQLFNTAQSGLTTEQAAQVWSTLSQRFAQGASGNAVGFVNGARAGSIFNTVEYPTLVNNPSIVNVITGGH